MNRKKSAQGVLLALTLLPSCIVLADTASDYQNTQAYISAQNLAKKADNAVSAAESVLPPASGNADKSEYYDSPEKMEADTTKNIETPGMVGRLISDNAQARPKTMIGETDAAIKNAKEIQDNADAISGKDRIYCSSGECQETDDAKNEDFGKSITEISAVNEEATGVKDQGGDPNRDPNSIRIFTGRVAHCRDIMLGARNCCADSGWASGVVHCRGEEKDLGSAKEKGGLVVYTGRYCSHHILGYCSEHKKGYCIFPSRIAYDVQVGGRQAQLGRGFGDGKNPDCSGLSPNDIVKINLDKIDLSNIVDQTKAKTSIPDNNDTWEKLEKKVKRSAESEPAND